MSFLDTRHKRKSFTVTSIILAMLIALMFYVGLSYLDPPPEEGISVNFGYMDTGSGDVQPKEPIRSKPEPVPEPEPVQDEVEEVTPPPPEPEPVEPEAEEVVTQESEESVVMKKAEEERLRKLEEERKAKERAEQLERERIEEEQRKERERIEEEQRKERERQAEQERVRKEQEAKKARLDAMMGGLNNSDGKATGGEGDDNSPGDKGQLNGDPYASSYFGSPGSGSGGSGYGLNGRNKVGGQKIIQDCNEEGRVVVKIVVDRNGRVVEAQPGVRGTTNTASCLLEPAKRTALTFRFNSDPKAPSRQIGFVVVNFKLGE
ncbi:energy transducer TonB [Robertkochia sediminum]|uniref:energy transducer TonB n=1 Tax=Robertkochia sediminum TaxID=2785326 RepID=UPI001934360C|nr:energy transducer TonB [Robertkochia sediminum]MBL7472494.1 energy transducer TonB [Robertkochia sediminum]